MGGGVGTQRTAAQRTADDRKYLEEKLLTFVAQLDKKREWDSLVGQWMELVFHHIHHRRASGPQLALPNDFHFMAKHVTHSAHHCAGYEEIGAWFAYTIVHCPCGLHAASKNSLFIPTQVMVVKGKELVPGAALLEITLTDECRFHTESTSLRTGKWWHLTPASDVKIHHVGSGEKLGGEE